VAERMTIYAARDLTAGEATPMEDERIETRWFPMREIAAMIESGRIQDAKTIGGYALWQMKRGATRSGGKR
jgi:ADP-ribose pyrophosphatase